MLTVRGKGVLRYRYIISDEEKEVILRVTGAFPRMGEMEIGADRFRIYRERCFSGRFIFEKNEIPIAVAIRPRRFQDHFIITIGDLTFDITREERFNSGLTVWWGDDKIGTIMQGRKKVRALIDLPDSIALELQIFFFWLAHIAWERYAFLGAIGG